MKNNCQGYDIAINTVKCYINTMEMTNFNEKKMFFNIINDVMCVCIYWM